MAAAPSRAKFLNFRVLPRLHERVSAAAAARSVSLTEFARVALENAVTATEAFTHGHYHVHGNDVLAALSSDAGRAIIAEVVMQAQRQGGVARPATS